jgi:pyruvate dehydrogenase E1 component beta subunit
MFNGALKVPLVIRMPQGGGNQLGPTHSHSFEAIYAHVPGLLVAAPATPADAKGLLKTAIRDDNPVIFIEHESLYGVRGEVPLDEEHLVPFGQARVAREGSDLTIVAISRMVSVAEKAADLLSSENGLSAEVIDMRTLRPLDSETVLDSVAKTNHCVVVSEGWPRAGAAADIAALVSREAFDDLDAPVEMVSGADVPMPYSQPLERFAMTDETKIALVARQMLGI